MNYVNTFIISKPLKLLLGMGPFINYVSMFWGIFDTPLPHVSNRKHFNNLPLYKLRKHFPIFDPPPQKNPESNMYLILKDLFKKGGAIQI